MNYLSWPPALKRPTCSHFGSGPCAKRPGWHVGVLCDALVGRSHRSKEAMKKIDQVVQLFRQLLNIPQDFHVAIVPGSDTGAVEMMMWQLLASRPVDVVAFDVFGHMWADDIVKHLQLKDVRMIESPHMTCPDLSTVSSDHDVVFCYNGTTTGIVVPNLDWIASSREGLVICDATSAVFAYDMDWSKLDVLTFSWQKVLGSEAAHGVLVLSPRAIERLKNYQPPWPVPKLFRLKAKGEVTMGVFKGETINTPSMLCVEDVLDALKWVESLGGLSATMHRSQQSLAMIEAWISTQQDFEMMVSEQRYRSCTSITIRHRMHDQVAEATMRTWIQKLCALLADEGVADDIAGHRNVAPHIRIWCGATVEPNDVAQLLPWITAAANYLGSPTEGSVS